MTDVRKVFEAYSKLNCIDLLTEVQGLEFEWYDNENSIYYFCETNPKGMIDLITASFGEYTYDSKGNYRYKDGTKARFIASRKWYEFKRCGKVIARVKIN